MKGNNQEMVEDLVRNGEILTRRDDVGQVSRVPVFYCFKESLAHGQPQGSLIDRKKHDTPLINPDGYANP